MTTPNQNQPICRNGHKQPNATSRFCIYCGTPLTNQATNQPIQPVQPQPVQQPPVAVPPPTANQNVQNYQNKPVQPQQGVPTPPINLNNQPPIQQNQGIQQPVYQQQVYQQQIYQQQIYQQQVYQQPIPVCQTCGGEGKNLEEKQLVCRDCQWLRPLAPGYGIEPGAFQWAEDGKAMSVLRSITPLTMAAQVISDKVGRRWIETTFNGVLLSEKQLPEVYFQAVKAARILGMSYMPDIYVSGELLWDCRTYGSDKDSFIVMGSALATNFRGPELLFLFAREMGHCRTGHALWKTVIKFLLGEQGPRGGVMSQGLFAAVGKVLSPTALIEGTIEVPLLAWARQAEITADRAGMLAVGNEEIVRKVLLSWSLKSPLLQRQINVEEWLKQQAANDDEMLKLSELMTTATPYITRRLKLIAQFAQSPELNRWQEIIKQYVEKAEVKPQPNDKNKQTDKDVIRMKCSTCGTPMRIPSKVFEGKTQMSIRCPDAKCGKLTYMKKKINPSPKGSDLSKKERKELERNLNYGE